MSAAELRFRYRIIFKKCGALRWIGHLDLHKCWERIFCRLSLPLVYSRGFHPRAKIVFAAPLPLGYQGSAEIVDIWLLKAIDPAELAAGLGRQSPPDISIAEVIALAPSGPSLPSQVSAAEYRVALAAERLKRDSELASLRSRIRALIDESAVMRTRRGKSYNLRPLIESLCLTRDVEASDEEKALTPAGSTSGCSLVMRLTAKPGATGRPEEVLSALEIDTTGLIIDRQRLILSESAAELQRIENVRFSAKDVAHSRDSLDLQ